MQVIEQNTKKLPVVIDGNIKVAQLIEGLRTVGLKLTQDGKGNLVISGQQGGAR